MKTNLNDSRDHLICNTLYTWNPFVLCFASKRRSFPIKTRDIWVPGIYIYISIQEANGTKNSC